MSISADNSSLLDLQTGNQVSCKIHPTVIFAILDHYVRRNDSQNRVIGTVLGVENDGVIEIKSSFPELHSESQEKQVPVDIHMPFHRNMLDLHTRASPNESVVGWYSTGLDINYNSVFIHHDFYWREMQSSPILLTVDTEMKSGFLAVKAYVAHNLGFSNTEKNAGVEFRQIHCEIDVSEIEPSSIEALLRTKDEPQSAASLLGGLDSLQNSLIKLSEMLASVSEFVDKVQGGAIPPDNKIGRFLLSAIDALGPLDDNYEKMFNNSLQDLLLVVYLANLTRTQLKLAEKLQSAIQA